MKRAAGQVGRTLGWVLHHTGMIFITVFFVFAAALSLLAFQLSEGPVQVPWLTGRLASVVSGQGIDIHIDKAALAWGGYRQGGAVPLYLQLGGITARSAAGVTLVTIRSGTLVFLPSALVGGKAPILVSSRDAFFQGSNVPVSMRAAIQLDGIFRFSRAAIAVTLGAGALGASGMTDPISSGRFDAQISPHDVAVEDGVLHLAPRGRSAPVVGFAGAGHLDGAWHGALTVTADALAAGDLAAYWPPALLVQTRDWVTYNVTAGTATGAKFSVGLSAPRNLSDLTMDTASGSFTADNVSVGWIPGAQPITGVSGIFALVDKNDISIAADQGRLGGMTLAGGTMHITGLLNREQDGSFAIPVQGSLPDLLDVLDSAPLHLLSAAPAALRQATGQVAGQVSGSLPLRGDVTLPQIDLRAQATLTDVSAPAPVAGLGLSAGTLALDCTLRDLSLQGRARLAGETAAVTAAARFGGRSPAIEFSLRSVAGEAVLGRFGLAADGVSGPVPFTLRVTQSAEGQSELDLAADLTPAALAVTALSWRKAAGVAGTLAVHAALNGERIERLTRLDATGPGLAVHAVGDDVKAGRLDFSQFTVGATDGAGSVTPPAAGGPWLVDFAGTALDISGIVNPEPVSGAVKKAAPAKAAAPGGPAWVADLRFSNLILAKKGAPALLNLTFSGQGQGGAVVQAKASAWGGGPISLTVTPEAGALAPQAVDLRAGDGGFLLRALGRFDNVTGGQMALAATARDDGTFGVLRLTKFRLMHAPGFAKVLQAISIYGAGAAASGPGVEFDQLVAPFGLRGETLTLNGARAFSSSLGFTASGTVDTRTGQAALRTTIIPAYAINSLPGRIPVVGPLFSAEKGGGLFAVRAGISGPLDDPDVSVNPLSVLTPGVLRDVFGMGGK